MDVARRHRAGLWGAPGAIAAVAIAVVAFARFAWDVPDGVIVQGALVGGLTSLLALGLALVYRANRIVNFAAGDLGAVPATLAVLLTIGSAGLGWWLALGVGLAASLVLGVAVEVLLIRRFSRSPRLVLTVATIGIAQLLAAGALLLPRELPPTGQAIPTPFDVHFTIDPIVFHGTDVVAFVAIPLVFVALALFLRSSDAGIAIRGGAESVERAASLGVPVRRLQTLVWVLATVLAFVAVFLRAGIVGLPLGQVLGPAILLRALAAAVVGRMERLPTIAVAAIVLGIVEQAVVWHWQEPAYVDPALFVVVARRAAPRPAPVRPPRRRAVDVAGGARDAARSPASSRARPRCAPRGGRSSPRSTAVLLAVPAFLSESKVNLAGRHPHLRHHHDLAGRADRLGRAGEPRPDGIRRHRRRGGRLGHGAPRLGPRARPRDRRAWSAPAIAVVIGLPRAAPARPDPRGHEARLRAHDVELAAQPQLLRQRQRRSTGCRRCTSPARRSSAPSRSTPRPATTTCRSPGSRSPSRWPAGCGAAAPGA